MQDYEIYMQEPMLEERAVPGGSSPTSLDSLLVEVRAVRRLLFYLLLIGAGTVLYFGQDVFLPVVLGILISLALLPPVAYLKKLYVPYPVGAILIVASIGALLYTGAINLSDPLTELFEDIPRIGERLEHHFQPFKETVEQITRAGDEIEKVTAGGEPGTTTEVTLGGPGVITSAASSFASSLTSVLIALILALFILGSGNLFFEKIVSSVPTLRDKKRAVHIVREVEGQVSRYLFTITIINFSLGVVIGIALRCSKSCFVGRGCGIAQFFTVPRSVDRSGIAVDRLVWLLRRSFGSNYSPTYLLRCFDHRGKSGDALCGRASNEAKYRSCVYQCCVLGLALGVDRCADGCAHSSCSKRFN